MDRLIDGLERELARKRAEVEALEHAIAVLRGEGKSVPRSREFAGYGITEAAEKLLKEIGPASTRTIADTLLDRGIRTRSKNFVATVFSTLDNSSLFRRRGNQWELVGQSEKTSS
jgi:hypothetical protein